MDITIYGRTSCGLCSAAKDKMVRMGLDFKVRDIDYLTGYHEGWRLDGSIDVLAGHSLVNKSIPMIQIGKEYFTYSGAMKRLKETR